VHNQTQRFPGSVIFVSHRQQQPKAINPVEKFPGFHQQRRRLSRYTPIGDCTQVAGVQPPCRRSGACLTALLRGRMAQGGRPR